MNETWCLGTGTKFGMRWSFNCIQVFSGSVLVYDCSVISARLAVESGVEILIRLRVKTMAEEVSNHTQV
jgi:hypothetical protein